MNLSQFQIPAQPAFRAHLVNTNPNGNHPIRKPKPHRVDFRLTDPTLFPTTPEHSARSISSDIPHQDDCTPNAQAGGSLNIDCEYYYNKPTDEKKGISLQALYAFTDSFDRKLELMIQSFRDHINNSLSEPEFSENGDQSSSISSRDDRSPTPQQPIASYACYTPQRESANSADNDDDHWQEHDNADISTPWWEQYQNLNKNTPKYRRGDQTPSLERAPDTPPIPPPFSVQQTGRASNNKSPAKNQRFAGNNSLSSSPGTTTTPPVLPFVGKTKDRCYREKTAALPGIIVDTHHSKHAPGLCGIYKGGSGTQFLPQDCTAIRQKEILDELMKNSECQRLNERPAHTTCINEFTVAWNGQMVKFSAPAYDPKTDSWYIHFFPFDPKK